MPVETKRPAAATIKGIRACLRWIDECNRFGWEESTFPDLERLFWEHHDDDGVKLAIPRTLQP
jgi:hypothetical protein